uniref:Globin family profile domain-containing protein n=1 Tax=Panagrolaimus sp. ES5 TaxID=591445 RepID=A0AC34FA93_9BILA
MFRYSGTNFDKEKMASSESLPLDFSVLNIKPSPIDDLKAMGRPGSLKQHKLTLIKSIDDHHDKEEKETKKIEFENNQNRIGADSRSESHKEVSRLNLERRELITESYEQMKRGSVNNALAVFVRMFAENPQYKNIWPQFRNIPDSSLISSDQLKNHAKVYFGGMKNIIESMNAGDESEFRNMIRRMARSHAKFAVRKSHIIAMLPEFIAVLKSCGVPITEGIKDAWYTLFDVIGNLLSPISVT